MKPGLPAAQTDIGAGVGMGVGTGVGTSVGTGVGTEGIAQSLELAGFRLRVRLMSPARDDTRYSASLAEHYDDDYAILRRDGEDVAFYTGLALQAEGPVMEIGCGTGRVALPVARAGCTVTGVDPTPGMLSRFAEKLAREPAGVRGRVTLREGSFRSVPGEGSFALVFSAFRAFQHLIDRRAQIAALTEMARWTAPGGTVAFDVFDYNAQRASKYADEHSDYILHVGDQHRERRSQASYDAERRLIDCRFRWFAGGEPDGEATFFMKISTRDELVELLPHAGLELLRVLGTFGGSPWTADEQREIVIIARRPSTPGPSTDAP